MGEGMKKVVDRTKKNCPNNDYINALSDSYTTDSRPALSSNNTIFIAQFIFYPEDGGSKFFRIVGTFYQMLGFIY